MTATISPFRRAQDARAAVAAAHVEDHEAWNSAWAEYDAAKNAARDYVLTPRESVERWAEIVASAYAELVAVEESGGDTGPTLHGLKVAGEFLAEYVAKLRGQG